MGFMTNKKQPVENLTKPIFYPLNQFHISYIDNARKGITDINWRGVLEQLDNDFEMETSEFLSNDDAF